MPQSCWPVRCDKGPLSQAVGMPQSCWPVTCDKGPSALDCETCCGSSWTSRSQTLDGPREVSKHRSTPEITSVEKPRRRHKKQNKAASTGTTEDQPGGDTGYNKNPKKADEILKFSFCLVTCHLLCVLNLLCAFGNPSRSSSLVLQHFRNSRSSAFQLVLTFMSRCSSVLLRAFHHFACELLLTP